MPQQQQLVRAFQEDEDLNKQNPKRDIPEILVDITDILDVGFTCISAFQMILLKPDWVNQVEQQTKACIKQIEQCNTQIYSYCIICHDFRVEQNIVDCQKRCCFFQKLSYEKAPVTTGLDN